MSIIADVFKDLFKMVVADLRLTLAILGGVVPVAIPFGQGVFGLGPFALGVSALCHLLKPVKAAEAIAQLGVARSEHD